MTDNAALGQNVPNMVEGLYLMDGIKGATIPAPVLG